jgi:hypothetical protein
VPAGFDEAGLVLSTGDLRAASEGAAVERPGSVADTASVIDWAMQLTGGPSANPAVFVPVAEALGVRNLAAVGEFDAELGWSIVDVDAFVEASAPPSSLLVVTGDAIGPDALADAQVSELGDGLFTAGEGEDHETDLSGATAARPLGTPLRIAVGDGRLAVASTRTTVERWLDGEVDTLAAVERYQALAAGLDDADPYAAVLSRPSGDGGGREATRPSATGLTAPYDLVGIAWSLVDGEAVITIVHHFGDDATAEAQAGRLRSTFTDGASLQTAEPLADRLELRSVEVDGPVTTTTLGLTGDGTAMLPYRMLVSQDLPFAPPR